jgi:hypothetical protein
MLTRPFLVRVVLFIWMAVATASAAPVGTMFTYQGKLTSGNGPANGSYDLQFALYDSPSSGTQIGAILTNAAVPVSNGVFIASLDFGAGVFTGEARWLEISVKTNNAPAFVTLAPRQLLTAAPYAIDAATAELVAASHISGVLPDAVLSTNVPLLGQSQIFTGSNFFQGPLVLTNAANTFAGQFIGNGAGLSNIPPVTTVLTTNSTFAEIKAAIAKGGLIWFQPGDYWSVDNLELTNNTVILGWNAVLHAKPGLTNFLIDEATSTLNISIYGLGVTGDRFLAYTAPNFVSLDTPYPAPYYQTNLINHGGMRLNMMSGGTINGCSASGFGGYGFMLVSRYESSDTLFYGNRAHDNGVGMAVLGPGSDYPGYPYAPQSTWPADITAEHQVISGNEIFLNAIGLYAPAGNCVIIGNKIVANNYGVLLESGPNDTHGEVVGNTLNHNNYAIIAESMEGEMIRNNMILDVSSIYIYGVHYLVFDGNQMIGTPLTITVTNNPLAPPSYVTISHNIYRGSWGSDIIVNTNFGTAPGMTYIYGNRSYNVSNDTDHSTASLLEIGGGVTTNYTAPGGATFYVTNGVIGKIQ